MPDLKTLFAMATGAAFTGGTAVHMLEPTVMGGIVALGCAGAGALMGRAFR